jgi:hypothetical protein
MCFGFSGMAAPSELYRQSSPPLFNCFVGTCEHCRRNFEAERLGCLEIDEQLEPGRLLDRQVCWFGAFENIVNEVGRAAIQADQVRAVTNQTPSLRVFLSPD